MQIAVETYRGAGYDEVRSERINSRNCSRECTRESRQRRAKEPQAAPKQLLPGVPKTAARGREVLTVVIQETFVKGISARSVDELVKAVAMSGVSTSQVSRLCAETRRARRCVPEPPGPERLAVSLD